jgi:hypothetical protein
MVFVAWPTVNTNVVYKTFVLKLLLTAGMARSTQALELTEPKQFLITMVRHYMIGHVRRNDSAMLKTHRA